MFTRFIIPVLFLTVVIAVGYLVRQMARRAVVRKKIQDAVRELEASYLSFLSGREHLADVRGEAYEEAMKAFVQESMTVIRPEGINLFEVLTSANQSLLPKELPSDIFPHLMSAYRMGDDSDQQLAKGQFLNFIQEALSADTARRYVDLQTSSS